jgi:hypothetical protein
MNGTGSHRGRRIDPDQPLVDLVLANGEKEQKLAALKQFAPSSGPGPRRPAQWQWPPSSPDALLPVKQCFGGASIMQIVILAFTNFYL